MLGVTVIVPAPLPLAGETASQLALSEAVQLSVPPPALDTLSVLAAGLAPSCVPLNDRLAGLTARVGGDGAPPLKTTVAIDHELGAPLLLGLGDLRIHTHRV